MTQRAPKRADAIDALAVTRATLRARNLPMARLDGVERELLLLVAHGMRQPREAKRTSTARACIARPRKPIVEALCALGFG